MISVDHLKHVGEISVDYGIHLTSKSNGSHGHWSTAARVAKRERTAILNLIDRQMQLHAGSRGPAWQADGVTYRSITPGPAFQLRKVSYTGRFRGQKVTKTKMVRELIPAWQSRLDSGLTITLTRYAEKPLDDDGLRKGFKHIRDGAADAFGLADNDPRLKFEYAQVLQPPSRVNVRIEWKEPAE